MKTWFHSTFKCASSSKKISLYVQCQTPFFPLLIYANSCFLLESVCNSIVPFHSWCYCLYDKTPAPENQMDAKCAQMLIVASRTVSISKIVQGLRTFESNLYHAISALSWLLENRGNSVKLVHSGYGSSAVGIHHTRTGTNCVQTFAIRAPQLLSELERSPTVQLRQIRITGNL